MLTLTTGAFHNFRETNRQLARPSNRWPRRLGSLGATTLNQWWPTNIDESPPPQEGSIPPTQTHEKINIPDTIGRPPRSAIPSNGSTRTFLLSSWCVIRVPLDSIIAIRLLRFWLHKLHRGKLHLIARLKCSRHRLVIRMVPFARGLLSGTVSLMRNEIAKKTWNCNSNKWKKLTIKVETTGGPKNWNTSGRVLLVGTRRVWSREGTWKNFLLRKIYLVL